MAIYYNEQVDNNRRKAGVYFTGDPTVSIVFNTQPLSGNGLGSNTLSATFSDTVGQNGYHTNSGTIEIDGTYQGEPFFVQLKDRQTLAFIAPAGAARSTTATTLTAVDHTIDTPRQRRLRNLGII